MLRNSRRAIVLPALVIVAACQSGEPPERAPEAASMAVPSLASATAVGLRNASMPIDGLVTGGQPDAEQLEALAAAGFRNFISLRPSAEDGAGWEESAVDGPASFARIPIRGAADLTRDNVEALDRLLDQAGGEGTVVYCASGNRVGALLALRAAWLDGVPPDDALALGRAAGMTRLEGAVAQLLGVSE